MVTTPGPDTTAGSELARLQDEAVAWRALAAWLRDVAEYVETIEVPALLRTLQAIGVTRDRLADLLGLSRNRIDQLTAIGRTFERQTSDDPPPEWWAPHVGGTVPRPPAGYNPFVAAEAIIAAPMLIHPEPAT